MNQKNNYLKEIKEFIIAELSKFSHQFERFEFIERLHRNSLISAYKQTK